MPVVKYGISLQPGYVLVEDPPKYDVVWSEQPEKLQAIADACAEVGTNKVLMIGGETSVQLVIVEVLYLAREVGKHKLTVGVVNQHDAPKEFVSLLKDVSKNLGSPVRFFKEEQDARDWLEV